MAKKAAGIDSTYLPGYNPKSDYLYIKKTK